MDAIDLYMGLVLDMSRGTSVKGVGGVEEEAEAEEGVMVTDDFPLALMAAANSLTGLRSGESGKEGGELL